MNIYDKMIFPNPPIMPITLYPLMVLPTVTGAMCWFAIKVALTTAALCDVLRIVPAAGQNVPIRPCSAHWSCCSQLRPILGDLHHGNNNLLILFLVVAMYYAWRKGYDIAAGLLLALATSYKVTPALFFLYFAYKRSWRTVAWGMLGLGIFLLIVPSVVIGPDVQRRVPGDVVAPNDHAVHRQGGDSSPQEINQSLLAVLMRLLTNLTPGQGRYDTHVDLNVLSLPPWMVGYLFKAVAVGMIGLLAFLCRTENQRPPRPATAR